MFSKACKYAINSLVFLATLPEGQVRAGLKDIAVATNSPEAFTAKILQTLVRESILLSIKGPNGGFQLSDEARRSTIYRIVQVIDGDALFVGCALGMRECSEGHPCSVHHKFKAIRDHLTGMMMTTTLEEMATGVSSGLSFLRN
jgi:Rrf2 family iron-sulfur cluster assembly transcriptional regulator